MTLRRKPYPVVNITGGINVGKDPLYIQDSSSPDLTLVRYHKGVIKKDFLLQAFVDLTSERVMDFSVYRQYDGDIFVICCGVDHAYKYSASVWTKISSAGPVFTGGDDDIFYSTVFDDLFIVTNGKDAIQKWNGTTWAALGGSPPTYVKYLVPFYSRLVVAHTYESATVYPSRVRWSIIGDPETWTGTGSGAIDVLDTQDRITGLGRLGDRVFVFKEDSIWELYYVGGTDVFKTRVVTTELGCRCGKTIVQIGTSLCFMGSSGILQFDGSSFKSIGDAIYPITYETVDSLVDHGRIGRAHAKYDYESGKYILVLPTKLNIVPNLIISFDLNNSFWSKRIKDCTAIGYLYRGFGTNVAWSAATEAWSHASWAVPWVADVLGLPVILYGQSTGVVLQDKKLTPTTEEMTWESKDFVFSQAHRFTEVRYLCKGGPFAVYYSYDQGYSWTVAKTLTPSTSEFSYTSDELNVTGMSIRIRIVTSGAFELKWIEPFYIDRTRIV